MFFMWLILNHRSRIANKFICRHGLRFPKIALNKKSSRWNSGKRVKNKKIFVNRNISCSPTAVFCHNKIFLVKSIVWECLYVCFGTCCTFLFGKENNFKYYCETKKYVHVKRFLAYIFIQSSLHVTMFIHYYYCFLALSCELVHENYYNIEKIVRFDNSICNLNNG